MCGAHFALDRHHGALGVGHCLSFGHLAHHSLAVFKSHHRGGGSCAFRVGDDDRFAAFDNGYAGVCCAKVDTNDFCHIIFLQIKHK